MDEKARATFTKLNRYLRKASVARIGGFRPPDDPNTSWFGGRGIAYYSKTPGGEWRFSCQFL